MPGGRSRAFEGALHPHGARVIREFVSARAGLYVGACAGSYFGASSYAFDRGGAMEVLEPESQSKAEEPALQEKHFKKQSEQLSRLLCFHPGCASGPVLAPYDYASNSGAR